MWQIVVYLYLFMFYITEILGIQIDTRNHHPDMGLRVPALVTKYGYPLEVHTVITNDGYILTMHRIPHGKNNSNMTHKPAVFIMHGIIGSSADYLVLGPKSSIGYLLADMGYDVWMGNARGNYYSRNHIRYNPEFDRDQFWNFSWHEIGVEDLPTMIDYVLDVSNQKQIYYIGYSQGTTVFFVMTSMRPEYNKKIRLAFALAPVAYLANMTQKESKFIAQHYEEAKWLLQDMLHIREFLPSRRLNEIIGQKFCNENSAIQPFCYYLLYFTAGFNPEQFNKTLLPLFLSHFPAGSSLKQYVHFAQSVKYGKFRQFDYEKDNMLVYGTKSPPDYNLTKINIPIIFICGKNDLIANENDTDRIMSEVQNPVLKYIVTDKKFNHLDFVWSIDVVKLAYFKIFEMITKY